MLNKRIRSKNSSKARCCSCEGSCEGASKMDLSFAGEAKLRDRNKVLGEGIAVR